MTLAALSRQADIAAVQAAETALTTLHKHDFYGPQRIVLPPPTPPDLAAIERHHVDAALAGLPWLDRSARATARSAAVAAARVDADGMWAQASWVHATRQSELDMQLQQLLAGQPDVVMTVLETAFEDNQSPAACVDADTDADGTYATIVVVFGTAGMVPERRAALTPAGAPTLRQRTKTERNSLYAAALGSTVLATVKEAFAVVPPLTEIRLVVARKDPAPATADQYLSAVYAARFPRLQTMALPWATLDPAETLLRVPGAMLTRKGPAADVVALDVRREPELAQLIDAIRPAF